MNNSIVQRFMQSLQTGLNVSCQMAVVLWNVVLLTTK